MHLGIDLDNTLVGYDGLVCRAALEKGWMTAAEARNKTAVRDHMRRTGREPLWTELQGEIYGPRMVQADAFPGVLDVLRWARARGFRLSIISHKTRHPIIGPKHDLHAAARAWLAVTGIAGVEGSPIDAANVTFAERKEEKIAVIAARRCDLFIDDLPEILTHPTFPAGTQGVLFDPEGIYSNDASEASGPAAAFAGARCASWEAIRSLLTRLAPDRGTSP